MTTSDLAQKLAGLSKLADDVNERTAATERNWTAQIVIASSHGGLRPHFRRLEEEILRVLARIDDPRDVMRYLTVLRGASKDWLDTFNAERLKK